MSTNRDIVRRALRKLGALASGSNPADAEAQDALEILQSHYLSLVQAGTLGRLYDVIATVDGTALEMTRIQVRVGVTVTLPTVYGNTTVLPSYYPGDYRCCGWDDLCCDGPRPPRNQSIVALVDSDGIEACWMWKAEAGAWVALTGATLNSEFPFSEALANGFASWLAISLAPEYGDGSVAPGVQLDARNLSVALTHRYGSAYRPGSVAYY